MNRERLRTIVAILVIVSMVMLAVGGIVAVLAGGAAALPASVAVPT